jgi:GT2 family glycosyltransferase
MQPSVDVVIVNWNGGYDVLRAVRSAAAFGAEVIVVDNASTDGSPELIEHEVATATVFRMGRNAGFAAACNEGVRRGRGEYVFLLNPDAEIVEGTLADLVAAFSWHRGVAIVGARIVSRSGAPQRSARHFPTLVALILYQLKLQAFRRHLPPLRHYLMSDFAEDTPSFVDQVIGAAFIMRRRDWGAFGGLDEGYFVLFEEVDLARRVANAGGRSLHWPSLVVRHLGSTSFRRISHVRLQTLWTKSLFRYARRHLGTHSLLPLALTLPASFVSSLVLDVLRRPLRGSGESA